MIWRYINKVKLNYSEDWEPGLLTKHHCVTSQMCLGQSNIPINTLLILVDSLLRRPEVGIALGEQRSHRTLWIMNEMSFKIIYFWQKSVNLVFIYVYKQIWKLNLDKCQTQNSCATQQKQTRKLQMERVTFTNYLKTCSVCLAWLASSEYLTFCRVVNCVTVKTNRSVSVWAI